MRSDRRQIALRRSEHALRHEPRPGVRTSCTVAPWVTHSRASSGERALQHADQPQRRVPAAARLLPDGVEVELRAGAPGDRARRGGRTRSRAPPARARQRAEDAQPDRRAPAVVEQRRASRRSPTGGRRRASPRGRRRSSARRLPAARAARCAPPRGSPPHGTTSGRPARSMPRSQQAALRQRRGRRSRPTARGQKSTRACGSRPYSATWIWRERSQPTSVQAAASGGPASRKSTGTPGSSPRAAARQQVVRGRMGRGELAQVDRVERELHRRQVLVELEHRPRHLQQLRRLAAAPPRRRAPPAAPGSTMKLTCSKRPWTT